MDETLEQGGSVWDMLQNGLPSSPVNAPGRGIPGEPGGPNEGSTAGENGAPGRGGPFGFSTTPSSSTSLFEVESDPSSPKGGGGAGKGPIFGSPESIGLGVDPFESSLPPADPVIFGAGGSEIPSISSDLIGSEETILSSDPEILDVGGFSSDIDSDDDDLNISGPGRGGRGGGRGRG